MTATWEDVWEDLPSQVRLDLEEQLGAAGESESHTTASLFRNNAGLGEPERVILEHLRQDESLQLDELIERLEGRLESPEIFAALFELELAGRVRQLPGKNYLASM